jgi:hypothetical protein
LQVFEGLVSSEFFEKLKYLPFGGMERFQNKKIINSPIAEFWTGLKSL